VLASAAAPMSQKDKADSRIQLVPEGLSLGGEVLPLLAGSMHYFRHDPATWRPALEALAALGLRLVDTVVPWGLHEKAPGSFDFGTNDPRLDVAAFVRLAGELGLRVIVRPGPHVNAELTRFGLPERVIWTKECQALSAGGRPVVLPVPPLAFPVPSYASEAFHAEARAWLDAVGRELAPLAWPQGPIVLCQIDNDGSFYFRDGVYDQDYHPDSLALYRAFLEEKYENVEALREILGDPGATFFNVEPPRRFRAETSDDLARHLDWAEHQERLLASALERFRRALEAAGLDGIPTSHNLPLAEGLTALDPGRIGNVVELVGLDYYHRASARECDAVARRTSELCVRSAARGHVAYASELGAGYPPYFTPLGDDDNEFTALTALAYGLRGFNLHMAIERDRWIGAPVDRYGVARPGAERWRKLTAALERLRFWELERPASVHVVVPRSFRRLARVLHAFGPVSPQAVEVLGGGPELGSLETELSGLEPRCVETWRFLRALEAALEREGVAYAYSSDDVARHSLKVARWTIVACPGGLDAPLVERLSRARDRGQALTLGPAALAADGTFRPLEAVPLVAKPEDALPLVLPFDPAAIADAVATAKTTLSLPTLRVEPEVARATLHVDKQARPRALFVINPSDATIVARVNIGGTTALQDVLDGASIGASVGAFEIELGPRSVRLFELELEN
jgi:beta-galactosidase